MSVTPAVLDTETSGPSVRMVARLRTAASALAIVALLEAIGIVIISAVGDPRFPVGLAAARLHRQGD